MNWQTYQLTNKPVRIPTRDEIEARRKYAFGYFFEKRGGRTFRDLVEQYAPFLKEVYFPWPGLLSARELDKDIAPLRRKLIDDLKFCRSKGLALDLLVNAT